MAYTLRQIETLFLAELPVKNVRRGKYYYDFAITCFANDVWKVLGTKLEMQVRGSWFAPTNKARDRVDAIVYRVFRKGH
jgi:hypothetical protein